MIFIYCSLAFLIGVCVFLAFIAFKRADTEDRYFNAQWEYEKSKQPLYDEEYFDKYVSWKREILNAKYEAKFKADTKGFSHSIIITKPFMASYTIVDWEKARWKASGENRTLALLEQEYQKQYAKLDSEIEQMYEKAK